MTPSSPLSYSISLKREFVATAGALLLLLSGGACAERRSVALPDDPQLERHAHALEEFQEHIQEYVQLHRKLDKTLPRLGSEADAAAIAQHKQQLAAAIRRSRRNARQGEIFEKDVAPHVREVIIGEFQKPEAALLRAAINDQKPVGVALRVNDSYPEQQPVSLAPPSLLLKLPPLPEEVEFRFVNRHLLLLDKDTNLIVDFLLDAVPVKSK